MDELILALEVAVALGNVSQFGRLMIVPNKSLVDVGDLLYASET